MCCASGQVQPRLNDAGPISDLSTLKGRPVHPRRAVVLLVLSMVAALPARAAAQQNFAKVVAKTFDTDSVQAALNLECVAAGMVQVQSDNKAAIYRRAEGSTMQGGRQVQVFREITFHFEKAKTGTRIVATDEFVLVTPGGGEDRREVTPENRANDLQDVLNRVKVRLAPAAPDSAAAHQ